MRESERERERERERQRETERDEKAGEKERVQAYDIYYKNNDNLITPVTQ